MKLSHDVFDRPECPKEARYAAVDFSGYAFYYWNRPKPCIVMWSKTGKSKPIYGKFDNEDWENSLIERKVKWTK